MVCYTDKFSSRICEHGTKGCTIVHNQLVNPEDFRPKVNGQGDKYSWPLYKWLCKYKQYNNVYKTRSGDLLIGTTIKDTSQFRGKFLKVLCRAPTNLKMISFHDYGMQDVTEEFWADYAIRGMCAINPNYHDWEYIENTNMRVCNNCGIQQESMTVYAPKLIWISKNTIQEALYAGD